MGESITIIICYWHPIQRKFSISMMKSASYVHYRVSRFPVETSQNLFQSTSHTIKQNIMIITMLYIFCRHWTNTDYTLQITNYLTFNETTCIKDSCTTYYVICYPYSKLIVQFTLFLPYSLCIHTTGYFTS